MCRIMMEDADAAAKELGDLRTQYHSRAMIVITKYLHMARISTV